jgi:hypothetical protein
MYSRLDTWEEKIGVGRTELYRNDQTGNFVLIQEHIGMVMLGKENVQRILEHVQHPIVADKPKVIFCHPEYLDAARELLAQAEAEELAQTGAAK